jgi:phage shock protein PspC (stress-responsive transcriptional regulator)
MLPRPSRPTLSDPLPHDQRRARRPSGAPSALRRSREERVIAGVCGGIAAFVGTPPLRIRAIWLISLIPSLGVTALAYPLLWLLLPAAVTDSTPERRAR